MSETLKIALVDDQNLCRMGLCELLSHGYGFEVLGAVGNIEGLRKLIEPDPAKPRFIQTVWGLGYVFIPDGGA